VLSQFSWLSLFGPSLSVAQLSPSCNSLSPTQSSFSLSSGCSSKLNFTVDIHEIVNGPQSTFETENTSVTTAIPLHRSLACFFRRQSILSSSFQNSIMWSVDSVLL
ncbi:unnamed protein product, partial [Prunus brigantina]